LEAGGRDPGGHNQAAVSWRRVALPFSSEGPFSVVILGLDPIDVLDIQTGDARSNIGGAKAAI
jgi:hypothetical protein